MLEILKNWCDQGSSRWSARLRGFYERACAGFLQLLYFIFRENYWHSSYKSVNVVQFAIYAIRYIGRGVHLGIPNTRNSLLIFWFDRGNRGNLWPWKQIYILFFEILNFYRIFTCSQTLSSILKGATVCHNWDFLICYAEFNSESDSERKTRVVMGSRGC